MKYKKYLKESWINPKVEEKGSVLHGRGLFAKKPIQEGEVVVIWGGDFVNEKEARAAQQKGKAIQRIDENLWDVFEHATKNDDPSYNHNHSCDPNTWMQNEVTIIARRDIRPYEELTIDYATFVIDDNYVMPKECKCGSLLCRHSITGKDWSIEDIQKRYAGHFSPYLNKRINDFKKKDFSKWNREKKRIHCRVNEVYAHPREVWWCALGVNVGAETDGKNENFERPMLVLRVYNKETLLVLPITSKKKVDAFHCAVRVEFGTVWIKLTQARVISNRRLIRKVGVLSLVEFEKVKNSFRKYI